MQVYVSLDTVPFSVTCCRCHECVYLLLHAAVECDVPNDGACVTDWHLSASHCTYMHNNNNIYVCNGKQADHNLVILVKCTNLPKQIPLHYFVLYGIHVKHALHVPLPHWEECSTFCSQCTAEWVPRHVTRCTIHPWIMTRETNESFHGPFVKDHMSIMQRLMPIKAQATKMQNGP